MGAAFATIAAFSTIGVFIDFVLGKSGQKWVRDHLERWWIRMSYVRWGNLGEEEAIFCYAIMDRLFGKFISIKRFAILIFLYVIYLVVCIYVPYSNAQSAYGISMKRIFDSPGLSIYFYLAPVRYILMFSVSISLTMFLVSLSSKVIFSSIWKNGLFIIFLLLIQYVILCHTLANTITLTVYVYEPILSLVQYKLGLMDNSMYGAGVEVTKAAQKEITGMYNLDNLRPSSLLSGFIYGMNFDLFDAGWTNPMRFIFLVSSVANVFRLSILVIFLMSFLFSFFRTPIMTLFARVIESDKPIFTLVFGGAAAMVKAIQEVIKAFV